jgi:hypothetical protein
VFHISLRSRCTAMLAGLRTLIQTGHGPDRYVPSIFFGMMPSAPSRHDDRPIFGNVLVKQDPSLSIAPQSPPRRVLATPMAVDTSPNRG